ncbi:4Fe-4S binding protein [Bilophila wadsworthia]|uniref:4Fe-4S binding protein n=1 Tax=Bilophila wadsworthia TaxID=35833 RepID=UPI0034622955
MQTRRKAVINSIDVSKCTGCGTCFKTCGLDVFRLDTEHPVLSPCMAKCPAGTVHHYRKRSPQQCLLHCWGGSFE